MVTPQKHIVSVNVNLVPHNRYVFHCPHSAIKTIRRPDITRSAFICRMLGFVRYSKLSPSDAHTVYQVVAIMSPSQKPIDLKITFCPVIRADTANKRAARLWSNRYCAPLTQTMKNAGLLMLAPQTICTLNTSGHWSTAYDEHATK